jgi:FAD/FMN-containing dehydrogenase
VNLGRRSFLRLVGVSAAGVVTTACSPTTSGVPSSATPPGTTGSPSASPDWSALSSEMTGDLLRPGHHDFETAKRVFNPLFDGRKPIALARCATPEDVRACVTAAAGRVPMAPRSGGHSYAGYSTPDGGLVIDVGALSKVDVQGDQVVIGAGARLRDVYAAVARTGRCLPAGTCPTVGIAGLTLGGGIGVLTRKYGLTCDHLVSANVVTADGTLRTASSDSEPDLFWALRGGGGGNFGIVTEFTFTTAPAPDVTVFALRFPPGAANDVLGTWQQWMPTAPPELWSAVVLTGGSPVGCRIEGCLVGDETGLAALLDAFVTRTGATPASRTARSLDYLGAMSHFAGGDRRQSFVGASRIITSPVDAASLTATMEGRTETDLLIDSLGGAVADIGKRDTAFWHRDALATIQVYASATTRDPGHVTRSVNDVVADLAAAGATGAYLNYIDPGLPDWMNAYYGDNAARLTSIARTYDPDNAFRFAQSVHA